MKAYESNYTHHNVTLTTTANTVNQMVDTVEEHSKLKIAVLGVIYSLIFLIGIIGNSLVVYVVCRKKSMQSVTNLFIMNLALSDILMCLLAVPFTPISFFQDYWILGEFLCHLIPFSLTISVYVSTLTSLAIAIDRYFVIVHPFKPRMKLGVCILLIGVIWIVSISISLPLAIYNGLKSDENTSDKYKCQESWPIPMSKRFFNIASLVLQYLIPFTVITYSYTKVWIILSNRTRPGKTKEKERLELKRKKKTNHMLVAMVTIFAGCWMPLNCVHVIMEFSPLFTKQDNFDSVFFIAHVIAMSSTMYNPFLYSLNENFRKEFHDVIPFLFLPVKPSSSHAKSTKHNNTIIINRNPNLEGVTFDEEQMDINVNRRSFSTASICSKNGVIIEQLETKSKLINRDSGKRFQKNNENIELSRISSRTDYNHVTEKSSIQAIDNSCS